MFGTQLIEHPNVIVKSNFIKQHVDSLAHNERANELPGISNSLLIGSLFHQQCEPWKHIASNHLLQVWKAVKQFLEILLDHLTDTKTCNQLFNHVIEPVMQSRRDAVRAKLEELMTPHQDFDPIDIDPHFARKIWSIRQKRVTRPIAEMIRKDIRDSNRKGKNTIPSVDDIVDRIHAPDSLLDDKYGSNETFEFMQLYYDVRSLGASWNLANL
jgi:hypothetical protein